MTESGNFEGHNILNMHQSYQEFADAEGIEKEALRNEMRAARARLLDAREQRVRPGKDDKILASWNALAISAFARAAVALDSPDYLEAAQQAADFVLNDMRRDDGRLLHTWRHSVAKVDGFLDDYSYMIVALLNLYAADLDQRWIGQAIKLKNLLLDHFSDASGNGFYFTADYSEKLIARTRSFQDSSVPSGNSMAALGFLRLGRLLGDADLIETAKKTINASADLLKRSPLASGQMLIALNESLDAHIQLVFVSNEGQDFRRVGKLCENVESATVVCATPNQESTPELALLLQDKVIVDEQPTLYICRNFSCDRPVVGWEQVESALSALPADSSKATLN